MPPDYAEVPKPGSLEKKEAEEADRKKIEQVFKIEKEKSLNKTDSGSVEDSILKRIDKWKKYHFYIRTIFQVTI